MSIATTGQVRSIDFPQLGDEMAITGCMRDDVGVVCPLGHEVREGDCPFADSSPCPYRDLVVFEVLGFEEADRPLPECISVPFSAVIGRPQDAVGGYGRRMLPGRPGDAVEPWVELFLPRPGTVYVAVDEGVLARYYDGRSVLDELAQLGWHSDGCKLLLEKATPHGSITEHQIVSRDFPAGSVALTSPVVGSVFVALEKPNLMVTLSIASVADDGCLSIDCLGLSGDTLATLKQMPDSLIASIEEELATTLLDVAYSSQGRRQVKCVTLDSRLLDGQDKVGTI